MKKLLVVLFALMHSFLLFSQTGRVSISKVYYDSPFDESVNGYGEYIELYNSLTSDVDLSGWTLKDNYANEFTFPEGTIITTGDYKVITYGNSSNLIQFRAHFPTVSSHESDVVFQKNIQLNNKLERIFLRNAEYELVDRFCFCNWWYFDGVDDCDIQITGIDNPNIISYNTSSSVSPAFKKGFYKSEVDDYYGYSKLRYGFNYHSKYSKATISPFEPLLDIPTHSSIEKIEVELSDQNYIHTVTLQEEVTDIDSLDEYKKLESITYYDGLGRPMQSIAAKGGGSEEDIITHIEYDDLGRQSKEYLPYASSSDIGQYRTNANTGTESYYTQSKYASDLNTNAPNPFLEKDFEASSLNRVVKESAPGYDWRLGGGREIKFEYLANTDIDSVKFFEVTFTSDDREQPTLVNTEDAYYQAGELYKDIIKDENHDGTATKLHTTQEFINKEGQLVLKRTYGLVDAVETAHDTYYVYDIYGNLTFVIPSKVTIDSISTIELSELCYQYRYDFRNRMVEKKIPGKDWEYIIYNNSDQPVLTQDALLRENNEWLFTKYDAFGREIYTGKWTNPDTNADTRPEVQEHLTTFTSDQIFEKSSSTEIDINNQVLYYTNDTFPNTNIELFTINYFDNYRFISDGLLPTTVFDVELSEQTKTLSTGSIVKVLDTNDWITIIQGYDDKGRLLYAFSENTYLDTTDETEYQLDFVGRVLKIRNTHVKNNRVPIVTQDVFSYDHEGRQKTHYQCIGDNTLAVNCGEVNNTSSAEMIASNIYDELGQLESKKVGHSEINPLQNVDYTYNIRGWLNQINNTNTTLTDDVFAFKINYNKTSINGSTALFNGNISETHWKTKNDNILRNYSYQYDALNRITDATSNEPTKYNVSGITYDKMGNIQTLNRKGAITLDANTFGVMDSLSYAYSNNQLLKVTDDGETEYGFKDGSDTTINDYSYDENGNLKTDWNKNIYNIDYNHLNLPTNVNSFLGSLSYIYDALGNKLSKSVSGSKTTQYAGNYIYELVPGFGTVLKFANHPEGYIEPVNEVDASEGFDYIYQAKDHLDNIRVAYSGNNSTLIDSDFSSGTQGWIVTGDAQIENINEKLKISANYKWNGVHKSVYNAPQDKDVAIKFDLNMGTTHKVMVTLWQYAIDGSYLGKTYQYYYDSGSYTLNAHSNGNAYRLRVKIEKSYQGIDDGVSTYFFVDNIFLNIKDVTIREEKNYYPFGAKMARHDNEIFGRQHNYGFGGKEEQNELGLKWLDFHARNYNPDIGRWMNIDNLSDHPNQIDKSPYAYAWNDPIYYNDPDGNCPECWDFIKGFVGKVVDTVKSAFDSAGTVSTVAPGQAAEDMMNEVNQAIDVVENPVENAQEVVIETVTAPIDNVDKLVNGNAEEKGAATAAIVIAYVAKKAGVKTPRGQAGRLKKQPRGKGSVPPSQRAKPRMPSKSKQNAQYLKDQGKCRNCGNETPQSETTQHHYPDRHADGGSSTVTTCKTCHENYLHKK